MRENFNSLKIYTVLLIITLLGYIQFFFGYNFFVHQDQSFISNYSYGNFLGNGWRPDKGFGYSAFFGDSSWHPWSFYSLLEHLINDKNIYNYSNKSYGISVILISFLSSASTYFFFKRINIKFNKFFYLIIPLVVFSSGLHGTFFLRIASFAVGIPFSLLLINNFLNQKFNLYQYIILIFTFSLILFFTFIFGRMDCVGIILSTTFIFFLSTYFYYKLNFLFLLKKIIPFYILSIVIFFFLSSFILYSSIIEIFNFDYVRTKNLDYSISTLDFLPVLFNLNSHSLFNYIIGIFQVEWFPRAVGVGKSPGVPLSLRYAYNITPIFPLIFIYFLTNKSNNFWEYFFKFYLSIFFIHNLLLIFPFYNNIYYYLFSTSKLLFYFGNSSNFAQLGLLVIFLYNLPLNKISNIFIKTKNIIFLVSFFLFLYYLSIFLISISNYLLPNIFSDLIFFCLNLFPDVNIYSFDKNYIYMVLSNLIEYWLNGFNLMHICFSLTNCLLLFPFLFKNYFEFFYKKNLFTLLILINFISISLSVYSLNNKKLAWESHLNINNYNKYDRFLFVHEVEKKTDTKKLLNYLNKVKSYQSSLDYYKTYYGNISWELSPFFNLHGHRSFLTMEENQYFNLLLPQNNMSIRSLYKNNIFESKYLDIASVKYVYSKRMLKNYPENYKHIETLDNGISIYENLKSYPYYYLAKKLIVYNDLLDLKQSNLGDAFTKEMIDLKLNSNSNGLIKMNKFTFGELEFSFMSDYDELMVIADSWHPFWKALSDDRNLEIIKINGIFKGIILPKGSYNFKLYFDTSNYNLGIFFSFFSFLVLLIGLLISFKKVYS